MVACDLACHHHHLSGVFSWGSQRDASVWGPTAPHLRTPGWTESVLLVVFGILTAQYGFGGHFRDDHRHVGGIRRGK